MVKNLKLKMVFGVIALLVGMFSTQINAYTIEEFTSALSSYSDILRTKLILKENPDFVNTKIENSYYGKCTPLALAVHYCNRDNVRLLLEYSADPNVPDDIGRTPLHFAPSENIANILLSHGAEIDAVDEDGKTPLHYAAMKDNYYVGKLLVNKGADVTKVDKYGYTALKYAKETISKEVTIGRFTTNSLDSIIWHKENELKKSTNNV